METKYDGEHFLLHRLENGKSYKFYSRRGLEHTDEDNDLTKFAHKLSVYFKPTVGNCVLDGELVVKDMKTGAIREFHLYKVVLISRLVGKNLEGEDGVAHDVKSMKDGSRYKRVFIVFDILLLNNQECYQKPLVERLKILDSSIFSKTDPDFVFISEKHEMSKM